MSRLIVTAEATNGASWSGKGGEPNGAPIVAVSVTDSEGVPAKGMGMKNFTIHFLPGDQINPVFVPVSLSYIDGSGPGVYVLALYPPVLQNSGVKYIYAISVSRPRKNTEDRGQTLTTLQLV